MSVTTEAIAGDSRASAELAAALDALRADAFAFGTRFVSDARVRRAYLEAVRDAANELMWRARSGQITYAQAATEANTIRNALLETARSQTSEVMRAYVKTLKAEGLTLESLIARHAKDLFGKAPEALTAVERDQVMRRILEGAARARPSATAGARMVGRLGRGLIWLSVGIAFYNVWQAEDPGKQAVKEGAILGAGMVGAMAGGAAAGLVCGPAAPVCSGIGVLVGGALFAFGVSMAIE
jgi:hypothetical protein